MTSRPEKFPTTKQDLFDIAAKHLLSMKRRCYDEKQKVCKYRLNDKADDEECCPIGACIPDKDYEIEMEEKGSAIFVLKDYRKKFGLDNLDQQYFEEIIYLSTNIQRVHDLRFEMRKEQLRNIADSYNLKMPE